MVDAHERPGDAWRKRYKTLYLHDPIWLDHFPYLPFPDHWPLYTSKDKMGDWLEAYARVMELNVWCSTVCTRARFDEAKGEWEVAVERGGETLTLRPTQLVLATGLSGGKHVPEIPGAETFEGAQYHSGDHPGGRDMTGRRCVVIGSNNSAHDVCVDLWENDAASVTMIQRSPTIVVRAQTMRALSADIPYARKDFPTDAADLLGAVTPYRLRAGAEIAGTRYIRDLDAEFYRRLAASGFQLSHGEDESGFFMAYFRRAAGYYIDVGGSDLIAEGEIAVRPGRDRGDRAWRRAHGRRRAPARGPHRLRHRLSADGRMGRPADLARGGGLHRPLLGPRLGNDRRSRTLGGRAAQHVEAHAPAEPVVPGRQPRPVAVPLPAPGPADQGADGGPADAGLLARSGRRLPRAAAGPSPDLQSMDMPGLFDTHAHLIADDPVRYPPARLRGQADLPPLPPPVTDAMLLDWMDASGVARACLVQRPMPTATTTATCSTAPRAIRAASSLSACSTPRTRRRRSWSIGWSGSRASAGCACAPYGHGRWDTGWFNSPQAMKVWEIAAEHRLPAVIIFFHYHLPYALPALGLIADLFPELPIIVDHIGCSHASTPEVVWGRERGYDMDAPGPPDYGLGGRAVAACGPPERLVQADPDQRPPDARRGRPAGRLRPSTDGPLRSRPAGLGLRHRPERRDLRRHGGRRERGGLGVGRSREGAVPLRQRRGDLRQGRVGDGGRIRGGSDRGPVLAERDAERGRRLEGPALGPLSARPDHAVRFLGQRGHRLHPAHRSPRRGRWTRCAAAG
ncbi:MAG: NAD(P)-binding domain-containing protein [Caulobacteraceae bacterium]